MAEALLVAYAIVLFFLIRRQEKVSKTRQLRQEKIWVRPIFQEETRRANSQYYNLVKELGLDDREYFR